MTKRLPLHPRFREDDIRPGFYTADGDWVSLDPSKMSQDELPLLRDKPPPERERWLDPMKWLRRHITSIVVLTLMGCASAGAILAILIVRLFLTNWSDDYGSYMASLINAVVIMLFNMSWRKIALALTSWENYRLEKDFRASLIYRMFSFQFLNCYFSIFYVAFIKRYGVRYSDSIYDKCEPGPISDTDSCMYEIWYLVVFILAYNLVVGAALEMYLPFQKKLVKRLLSCFKGCSKKRQVSPDGELGFEMDLAEVHRKVRKGGVESLSKHEAAEYQKYMADMELVEQFERPELKSVFQGLGSTFYEYNELCVQFGYIIMFSVVFPLGALFALANNFLEIRLDAHKALDSTRRVRPSWP